MLSDAELIDRARTGDRDAWSTVVHRHSQLVFANARAAGADRAMAEDVTQLVWIKLLNHLDRIREADRLRGWLAIVARNTARSELRRQRPTFDIDSLLDLASDDAGPELAATRSRDARLVRRGLAAISGKCRELLTLLFAADMSYDEVSATLNMPVGSIGPTRQRCLSSLARALGDAPRIS